MLCNDAKCDTIKYQEMLAEAFDLIQKLSDEQLQKNHGGSKMKIWAISKEKGAEYEIGMECDGMDRETAMTELYRMARNLFTGELELFWKEGEAGKAAF